MHIENRIKEFEFELCTILSRLAYHIDPTIVRYIQSRNIEEYACFENLFQNRIEILNYLFHGSACVFPGVRRYVAGQGKRRRYNASYQAIIDDNTFPRHIWSFLASGKIYSGATWRETGLNEFELAHIFTHKESEIEFEKVFFESVQAGLKPYSDFTCAGNIVLLPKGTVRPTDNSETIKAIFYMRYIELYGEETLIGRAGFRKSLVPGWYSQLQWNNPYLPADWQNNIERLLEYRTKRIKHIMENISP